MFSEISQSMVRHIIIFDFVTGNEVPYDAIMNMLIFLFL